MLGEKAYANQALIFIKNKNYDAAVEIAEEMHQKYPRSYLSSFTLAKAYFWKERFDDAEKRCKEAVALAKTPDEKYPAYFLLASIEIALSKPKEAYLSLKNIPRTVMSEQYWELMVLLDCILDRDSTADFSRLYAANKEAAAKLILDMLLKYKQK